jgi:hypothetical protein
MRGRGLFKAVAATVGAVAGTTVAVARAVANVVYSPTVKGKVAQGATEISNALYGNSAYSPYTAENAAHRSQYQNRDASRGLDR